MKRLSLAAALVLAALPCRAAKKAASGWEAALPENRLESVKAGLASEFGSAQAKVWKKAIAAAEALQGPAARSEAVERLLRLHWDSVRLVRDRERVKNDELGQLRKRMSEDLGGLRGAGVLGQGSSGPAKAGARPPAWRWLQTAIGVNPVVSAGLARAYLEDRDYEHAIAEARKAAAMAPDFVEPAVIIATVYQEQGRYEEANKLAAEVLARNPSSSDAEVLFKLTGDRVTEARVKSGRLARLSALWVFAAVLVGIGVWLGLNRSAPETAQEPELLLSPPGTETLGAGTLLGGLYRVEAELGRGTHGIVFRALDLTLQRPVAVKMLRQYARGDARSVERLLQEARLVAGLKHPNIVEIHTALVSGDDILLVFEYAPGKALNAVLEEHGRLTLAGAKTVLRQVAEALDYAHSRRIIHRDLKPANIMLSPDGKASVMDFGLAHRARSAASVLTQAAAWGSPAYMAPEQEKGIVSAASDVYSLGACFYEMVTGALPFDGPDPSAQKRGMLFVPPTHVVPSLPRETDALVRRALDAEPGRRFAGALALAEAAQSLPEASN